MPIPQEILSVKRPKNTIVTAYSKDKNLYALRQRIGCKNINGRHVPVNGPTIGHIIDGRYVAVEENVVSAVSTSDVELKDWAIVEFVGGTASFLRRYMMKFSLSRMRIGASSIRGYFMWEMKCSLQ